MLIKLIKSYNIRKIRFFSFTEDVAKEKALYAITIFSKSLKSRLLVVLTLLEVFNKSTYLNGKCNKEQHRK